MDLAQKITAVEYFQQHYSDYIENFTTLSSYGIDEKGEIIDLDDDFAEFNKLKGTYSLVQNSKTAFNFDKIKDVFMSDQGNFRSVDALLFLGKKVYLLEFKTGFSDRVDVKSYNYLQLQQDSTCKQVSEEKLCEQLQRENIKGYNYFFNLRNKVKQNLALTLIVKLYDSLAILNKIFKDNNIDEDFEFYYWIIVDTPMLKNKYHTIKELNKAGDVKSYKKNETLKSKLEKYAEAVPSFLKEIQVIDKDSFNEKIGLLF